MIKDIQKSTHDNQCPFIHENYFATLITARSDSQDITDTQTVSPQTVLTFV